MAGGTACAPAKWFCCGTRQAAIASHPAASSDSTFPIRPPPSVVYTTTYSVVSAAPLTIGFHAMSCQSLPALTDDNGSLLSYAARPPDSGYDAGSLPMKLAASPWTGGH